MSQAPIITIIDDDDAVRLATESLVRSLGLRTRAFASVEAFLGSAERHVTACIITDVQMPGMNGMDLQARLRVEGDSLPFIFITAFPEERLRSLACAAGAVGFLAKPFEGDALIRCIDDALRSTGQSRP